jgi:hypothetical protein
MFDSTSVADVIDFATYDNPMKTTEIKNGVLVKRFSLPKEEMNLMKLKQYK